MLKITNYFSKEGLGVLCLMIPLLAKWCLPPGLEERLYVDVLGIFYLFLPNILLLFTPLLFTKVKKRNSFQFAAYCLWVLAAVVVVLFSKSQNPTYNIFSNNFLAGALYLGLFHKCSLRQAEMIRPLLYFGGIVIALQFIIFGSGMVKYDFGGDGSEFGGILRVYSTAGAATGAGAILAILAVLSFYTGGNRILKWVVLIVAIIGVFFTISRSPIALLVIMAVFLIFHYRKTKKKVGIYIFIGALALYGAGVFDPILERQEQKREADNFWSRRDDLMSETLSHVKSEDAYLFGLGVGNVYESTEVIYSKKKAPFAGAPHNSYILLFSEQGIWGILCITIMLLLFITKSLRRNGELTMFYIFVMVTVFFSETATTTNSEYVYLTALLMMMINSDNKFEAFHFKEKNIRV